MSIYGKHNGALVKLQPRVKHNGVIKVPLTGWTKKDGILQKIWDSSLVPTPGENAYCKWTNQVTRYSTWPPHIIEVNLTNKKTGALMSASSVTLSDGYFYPSDGTAEQVICACAWGGDDTQTILFQPFMGTFTESGFPYKGVIPYMVNIDGETVSDNIKVTVMPEE